MSANTQSPNTTTVIEFVKVKSWYIPADAKSYQTLRSLKVPLLKLHQDFIPTLQMVTRPAGIRARSIPIKEVMDKFMDKIGEIWLSKPGRRCRMNETRSVFHCKSTPKNRKSINKLDSLFQEFTSRWGFSYSPVFSETPKELKLVLDYKFDPSRSPVVPAVVEHQEPVFELELGFTKIKITFDVRRMMVPLRGRDDHRVVAPTAVGAPTHILEIFSKAGTGWIQVHTGSFTMDTIGDMSQFLGCLSVLHAQKSSIPS